MSEEITRKIALFTETACASHYELTRYTKDRLSSEKRRKVEEHLADCEFCSDALEGYELIEKHRLANKMIAELNDHIRERMGMKSMQVLSLYSKEIAIGAIGLFIIVAGAVIISNLSFEDAKEMTQRKQATIPEETIQPETPPTPREQASVPENNTDSSSNENTLLSDTNKALITEDTKENNKIEIRVRRKDGASEKPETNTNYIDPNKSVNYSGGFIENRKGFKLQQQKASSSPKEAEPASESKQKTSNPAPAKLQNFDPDKTYTNPEIKPGFPGGKAALDEYMFFNKEYPKKAREDKVQGTVIVGFVVDKDGKLDDISIIKGVDKLLDKEALKLVKDMPQWVPAKQNGVPVAARHSISVEFTP